MQAYASVLPHRGHASSPSGHIIASNHRRAASSSGNMSANSDRVTPFLVKRISPPAIRRRVLSSAPAAGTLPRWQAGPVPPCGRGQVLVHAQTLLVGPAQLEQRAHLTLCGGAVPPPQRLGVTHLSPLRVTRRRSPSAHCASAWPCAAAFSYHPTAAARLRRRPTPDSRHRPSSYCEGACPCSAACSYQCAACHGFFLMPASPCRYLSPSLCCAAASPPAARATRWTPAAPSAVCSSSVLSTTRSCRRRTSAEAAAVCVRALTAA